MNSDKPKGFLAQYGADLIDAGYDIIPIKRGQKWPPFTGWEKIRADHDKLDEWLAEGYGGYGVGIISANTTGVDIDVYDDELARHMEEWVHDNIGVAPVRIGNAPKRLLMFRTDDPFPKINAIKYTDHNGQDHKIEILGDGQQFVAYHIHPDTGKPYQWLYKDGPLVTDRADLPELTYEQAMDIRDEFERQCEARGWSPKVKTKRDEKKPAVRNGRRGRDMFLEDTNITDISDEELHAKLLMVPAQPDYDGWLQIGMALYHQYDGGERGLELWHEWSEEAYPDEYDPDEIDQKWDRGKLMIDGKGRAPVTARLIIKLAKEHAEKVATEVWADINRALTEAKSIPELKAAAEKAKHIDLDVPTRAQVVGLVQTRFKMLSNQNLSLRDAKDMVRYESPEVKDLPRWLEDWVYLSGDDKFYSHRLHTEMSPSAFNSAFSRFMLTKKDVLEGRAMPERLPAHVALNLHQIPVLAGKRYIPGMEEVFKMNGVRYVNTYTDRNVPEVPDKLTKADKRNIQYVKDHFTHLFTDTREARILLDFIAFIVQNPGKRPGWAVLMQGAEGDGKTFFGMLLGAVLGSENVKMLDAQNLQSEFNGWAEGHQLVFIEEIRLHGHNRYDVLNRIKPLITNDVIDIRRMRTDPYNVPNMASYMLATNFRDALPLTENDSRYFVLFSRFQTQMALKAFKKANPDYYSNLYDAIEESPGAIRGWLLNHEFGPDFNSGNRAPDCRAKGYMAMLAKPEEQEAIEIALNESMRFDISRTLLSATDLAAVLYDLEEGEVPQTRKMNKLLTDMGFTYLDRVYVNGRPRRYWSMTPEKFMVNGKIDTDAIRKLAETDL